MGNWKKINCDSSTNTKSTKSRSRSTAIEVKSKIPSSESSQFRANSGLVGTMTLAQMMLQRKQKPVNTVTNNVDDITDQEKDDEKNKDVIGFQRFLDMNEKRIR